MIGVRSIHGDFQSAPVIRAVVLVSSIFLMMPGVWGHSATVVEFSQLPAGLAAWQRQSLGIYRVCGPLSKFLYALPARLADVRLDYPTSMDSDVRSRQEWELGKIFQSQNCETYHKIYGWSRLLPVLVTILGAGLICEWSTRLFGKWPGIVSLCTWCWMPPILGHGALVTSDMPAAVTLLLAARSFWAFLLRPRPISAILVGLTLGLAAGTKFTLLVLYPCWAIMLVARSIRPAGTTMADRNETPVPLIRLITLGLVSFLVSILVIDALYLFQDVSFRLEHFQARSFLADDMARLREHPATAWLLTVPLPIPIELIRGLDIQIADTESSQSQSAYLLGWSRPGGWWYWYAIATLIKVPLPVLALFFLALLRLRSVLRGPAPSLSNSVGDRRVEDSEPVLALIMRGTAAIRWAALCLLVPAAEAAFAIAATTGTGTNAAFRYLIPSLALLCVWVGGAASGGSRILRIIIMSLLAWLAFNAAIGLPDHLGWRNELGWAWGRWNGCPALIGDSLEWGQDLVRLGAWVGRHSDEGSTVVCVYGFGDGEPYGLRPPAARPTSEPGDRAAYLAVSENVLFSYTGRGASIHIGGGRSSLSPAQCEALLQVETFVRVGRTIRVYRLRSLTPASFRNGQGLGSQE